ncbi:chorismate lyase [Duganella callida]|uniref:Probable chorismate pyruvate-lyase n=1 Tax=Duganella callida TaxID=2561932 RepID=A0A4Y9S857_9BURK|nr:chorismate lyase [Duganella callida]
MRQAQWQPHVLAVNPPPAYVPWLTEGGSLTARLKAHSAAFRVQCLHQRTARCLSDEAAAIGMHRPGRVWEREVLLRCDNTPAVFGHTVVPISATASDWPLFSHLGERSLGTTLFGDPLVWRGQLEFARLREGHPLAQRARAALGLSAPETQLLYARRCLYKRRQGTLLVTEVFLPSVLELIKTNDK